MQITDNVLGWILLAVLAILIFKAISDSVVTILRAAISILVAAEIIYFARLWIDIPILARLNWSWIEALNRTIVSLFQSLVNLVSNPGRSL